MRQYKRKDRFQTPHSEFVYKLLRVRNNQATVEFSYKEIGSQSPQRVTGRWLIDIKSGIPAEMKATITGYLGNPNINGEIHLIRA